MGTMVVRLNGEFDGVTIALPVELKENMEVPVAVAVPVEGWADDERTIKNALTETEPNKEG